MNEKDFLDAWGEWVEELNAFAGYGLVRAFSDEGGFCEYDSNSPPPTDKRCPVCGAELECGDNGQGDADPYRFGCPTCPLVWEDEEGRAAADARWEEKKRVMADQRAAYEVAKIVAPLLQQLEEMPF